MQNNLERLFMCYTSKAFRKDNYFVLYDMDDNVVCYFDNVDELIDVIPCILRNLVIRFKNEGNVINIDIGHKRYRLATFVD